MMHWKGFKKHWFEIFRREKEVNMKIDHETDSKI